MAWETVGNGGKNYDDDEEVTFVSIVIGTKLEGTIEGFGNKKADRFGSDGGERAVFFRGTDGLKYGAMARKIVLERFDEADLSKGDRFRLVVEAAGGKDGKKAYGLPVLQVDRKSDPAPKAEAPANDDPWSAPQGAGEDIPF